MIVFVIDIDDNGRFSGSSVNEVVVRALFMFIRTPDGHVSAVNRHIAFVHKCAYFRFIASTKRDNLDSNIFRPTL
jgi:hypothetical protein